MNKVSMRTGPVEIWYEYSRSDDALKTYIKCLEVAIEKVYVLRMKWRWMRMLGRESQDRREGERGHPEDTR